MAGPVRILHGGRDASVPYTHSLNLLEALRCEQVPPPSPPCPAPRQVELVLRREADHRFVEPESLAVITESVDTLLDRL